MCQSNTGVFAFKYYDGYDSHWPDFSTLHCVVTLMLFENGHLSTRLRLEIRSKVTN
jgi:hypothetical protein